MDYNIATEYMLAWYINSWSIIGLLLFIHSLYNQADVCRANHHPVYETKVRAKRKLQKSELVWTHGSLLPPTALATVLATTRSPAALNGAVLISLALI